MLLPALTVGYRHSGTLRRVNTAGSLLDAVEAELAEVERALARLDDGTYGTCQTCGTTIDDDQLATLPTARCCREHEGGDERSALDTSG
jgi:RNA polymerase-binding transcription factor DksA